MLLIFVSFSIFYKVSQKREEVFNLNREMQAVHIFLKELRHNGITEELKEDLALINYSILSENEQKKILENPNLKYKKSHPRVNKNAHVKRLILHNKEYVYIETKRGNTLLASNNQVQSYSEIIIAIFIFIFFVFVFLYFITLKKLKPLKSLKEKVKNFADEEFDISCASDKKDEISLLANEFDKSAKKLKKLKDSRNIFIRNIMHELKTPITKGKFLTELPFSAQNNTKMQKVFYRLESLINEFASIEELISTKKILQTKEYYLEDIIDNAIDILMCDETSVVAEYENITLKVDFKLFSIAIKNLIDNAIKYSPDKKVTIKTEGSKVIFQNRGKALAHELERYYEPFFSSDTTESNQSFGLGLYIVQNILQASGYKLEYEYKDELNIFSLQ
jgi:two-component system OmpR family sensor kinase